MCLGLVAVVPVCAPQRALARPGGLFGVRVYGGAWPITTPRQTPRRVTLQAWRGKWLAWERQRAEAASRSFAPAGTPRAVRQPETKREKQRKTDWRVWSFLVLFGSFVVRPITGWWPELVIGLAALGAYYCLVRRYRAYRQRQHADRPDTSRGRGSDD